MSQHTKFVQFATLALALAIALGSATVLSLQILINTGYKISYGYGVNLAINGTWFNTSIISPETTGTMLIYAVLFNFTIPTTSTDLRYTYTIALPLYTEIGCPLDAIKIYRIGSYGIGILGVAVYRNNGSDTLVIESENGIYPYELWLDDIAEYMYVILVCGYGAIPTLINASVGSNAIFPVYEYPYGVMVINGTSTAIYGFNTSFYPQKPTSIWMWTTITFTYPSSQSPITVTVRALNIDLLALIVAVVSLAISLAALRRKGSLSRY